MLSKEEIENLLKEISQGFRKIPQVENILYPLDINQFQKLKEYIEQLEADNYEQNNIINNYIENSIPKEVIEKTIKQIGKKEKEELKGLKGQDRYFVKQMYQSQEKLLQELMEGK